ncbi:MAG: hypothetical protein AAFU03_11535 [Bacteroidota bacterium]
MKRDELLQKFLEQGELTPAEQREFTRLYTEDQDFADEATLASAAQAAFNVAQKQRWREMAANAPNKVKPIRSSTTNWFRYGIAAAGLVLLATIAIWLMGPSTLDQQLNALLAEHHVAPEVTRSERTSTPAWEDLRLAYSENDFNKADQILRTMGAQEQNSPKYHFYTGLVQLYKQPPTYDSAVTHLEKALTYNSAYDEETNWFLSLACLKNGQYDQAILLLEQIAAREAWNWKAAQELLEKLK